MRMDYKLYRADETKRAELKRIISEILAARNDIGFAYLFGSFVDGREVFRDIDLGVWFRQGDRHSHFQEGIELSVQLTKKTTIPVDVRPLNDAPATSVYKVIRGELIDNTDDALRCRDTERTLREYFDIQPILQRAMKEAYSS